MSKPKTKKLSDAEAFNAAKVEQAEYFTASIFANRKNHTFSCDTRDEAEALARKMTGMADNGRKAMVYAVVDGAAYYVSTPA